MPVVSPDGYFYFVLVVLFYALCFILYFIFPVNPYLLHSMYLSVCRRDGLVGGIHIQNAGTHGDLSNTVKGKESSSLDTSARGP